MLANAAPLHSDAEGSYRCEESCDMALYMQYQGKVCPYLTGLVVNELIRYARHSANLEIEKEREREIKTLIR